MQSTIAFVLLFSLRTISLAADVTIYNRYYSHCLNEISARLRLTTPMPSSLRSNDDAARQASNIAEIIDFVNSVFNDDGRSIARDGGYDPMLRRFELPAVKGINLLASAVVPNDENTENLADTVRYQVINNPEVLEEYSNKQKQNNNEKVLKPVTVVSVDPDTSAEAKSFSTVEHKLRYYHSKSSDTSTDSIKLGQLHTPHPNALDGVQEFTTVEPTYRPSFPDDDDDDDDDDKPIIDNIEVTVTENKINTPRPDEKNDVGQPNINDTVEIEKKILDNKASDKEDQAKIEEEKTQMDATMETGQMKHELPLKKEKDNYDDGVKDGVTVNEEKSGNNKEYISTKLDHNSNERPSEDNIHPRDEDYKNDGYKKINGTTDNNSEIYNKPNERSWDEKIIIKVPVLGRIDKLALRTVQKNNNHDHKKQHSIYSHKERNYNSNKKNKNRHEKRDEYDRKKKDESDDRSSKKDNYWNKIDKQRYNKDHGYDRMEYEWKKRHQQYDEKDNWNINGNQWEENDYFNSRDRDSNKRDNDWDKRDNDWDKRDYDWDKRDNDWDKRDNDWKKRDFDLTKRDNDWDERDIDSNKRDSGWHKRENNWNKRHSEWITQDTKSHKDDRNKNDWDRKQHEWENKYSDLRVKNDKGIAHDRYKIVERKRKDGDYNKHSEV